MYATMRCLALTTAAILGATAGLACAKGSQNWGSSGSSGSGGYRAPSYKSSSSSTYKPLKEYAAPKTSTYKLPKEYAAPKASTYRPPKEYAAPKTSTYKLPKEYAAPKTSTYKLPKEYAAPKASTVPKNSGFSSGAPSRTISGNRKAHDGDTFYAGGVSYRVQGIDTPELGTPRADAAKQRLQQLISGGNVTVQPVAKDKYGRTVAKVMVNGEDVAEVLKREGYSK